MLVGALRCRICSARWPPRRGDCRAVQEGRSAAPTSASGRGFERQYRVVHLHFHHRRTMGCAGRCGVVGDLALRSPGYSAATVSPYGGCVDFVGSRVEHDTDGAVRWGERVSQDQPSTVNPVPNHTPRGDRRAHTMA